MKKAFWLLLALLVLIGSYFLVRPHWRLPFDSVSPFQAVSASSELLIQLPYLRRPDSAQLRQDHIWYLETRRLIDLLHEVTGGTELTWEDWWLLPENGRTNAEVVYTFIGSSKALRTVWDPTRYGPTLSYGGGEIYTYDISGDDPLYFSRYHNLLIVGRFPFQLETALQTAKKNGPAWTDLAAAKAILTATGVGDGDVIRQHLTTSSLPPRWQHPVQPWPPTDGTWSRWWPAERDSILWLTSLHTALLPSTDGTANARHWPLVPAGVTAAQPLVSVGTAAQRTSWEKDVRPWLRTGGWSLRLAAEQSTLWVLPAADSAAYRAFVQPLVDTQLLDQANYQLFDLYQLQTPGPLAALTDRTHWQPWVCELPEALIVGVFREDVERYLDYYLRSASLLSTPHFADLLGQLSPLDSTQTTAYGQWQPLADGEDNLWTLLFPNAPWTTEAEWLWQSTGEADGYCQGEAVIRVAPRGRQPRLEWTIPLASEPLRLLPVWDMTEAQRLRAVAVQSTRGHLWYFDLAGQLYWQREQVATLIPPLYQQTYSQDLQHLLGVSIAGWEAWGPNGNTLPVSKRSVVSQASNQFVARRNTSVLAAATRDSVQLMLPQGQLLSIFPVQPLPDSLPLWPLATLVAPGAELLAQFRSGQGWWVYQNDGVLVDTFPLTFTNIVGSPQAYRNELIVATADGRIHLTTTDGVQQTHQLGRGPLDNYSPVSLWGDNETDWLVQRGTLLHLFAGNAGEPLRERWQYRLPTVPDRIIAAPPLGTLALSNSERKVWLIDAQGQLVTGFPLAGEEQALLVAEAEMYKLLTLLDGQLCAYTWPK
ncbi:MAG: hypothetical protein AAGJ82_02160 [Bacteroidota bacterium]